MARKAKATSKAENKELSAAIKNLRASEEVESFYTFIHENKLRSEAHILMKTILAKLNPPKRKRGRTLQ